jgi:pimeloyl-ACP methyl ester carboxylesterase
MNGFRWVLVSALLPVFGACDDSDVDAAQGGAGGTGGAGGAVPNLEFSPCLLRDTQPFSTPPTGPLMVGEPEAGPSTIAEWLAYADQIPEMDEAMAECATMAVPARWADPEGDSIDVFVKRYPASLQPATGQLWMLEGGPGSPSSTLEHLAFLIGQANPTLDIYLPDHRGTGRSTYAVCGTSFSECDTAIPHLDGLTPTNAARDLAALIDATADGADVFVYGVSYGTYWAQRYLQIRPEQPTAVVLDSVVPMGMDFAEFDRNFDEKARQVLALCEADPFCSAKLGGDPIGRAEEVIAQEGSACELPGGAKGFFGYLVGSDYFDRLLLPASIYRVLRCDEADREWLQRVADYQDWYVSVVTVGFSEAVFRNIMYSEFWQTDATYSELIAQQESLLAISSLAAWGIGADLWPRYPRDEYYGLWPSSSAPTLALQGGFDARTPYGEVVSAHYSGEGRYYVELPSAVHGVLGSLNSPMTQLGDPGCGWQIIQTFLSDPSVRPDTSCIDEMLPIDFANPPPGWLSQIGIDDLWENAP